MFDVYSSILSERGITRFNVRFGSLADVGSRFSDVRFPPKADMLRADINVC
jgi:hypothetical protein